MSTKPKDGKDFEELVAIIERRLRPHATVKANTHLPDIHTGELRQIDVEIRLTDAYVSHLAIVEVRDRSRRADSPFVEQVATKRDSVGADVAIIVSKAGFYKPAQKKAEALRIRTVEYRAVANADWSGWLVTRHFGVITNHYNEVQLHLNFCGNSDNAKLQSLVDDLKAHWRDPVIVLEDGTPFVSPKDLIRQVVNSNLNFFFGDIKTGDHPQRKQLTVSELHPPIFAQDSKGFRVQVSGVEVLVECYSREERFPIALRRYIQPDSSSSLVEVAETEIEYLGKRMRVEMIAPGTDGAIPAGGVIEFRMRALDT